MLGAGDLNRTTLGLALFQTIFRHSDKFAFPFHPAPYLARPYTYLGYAYLGSKQLTTHDRRTLRPFLTFTTPDVT